MKNLFHLKNSCTLAFMFFIIVLLRFSRFKVNVWKWIIMNSWRRAKREPWSKSQEKQVALKFLQQHSIDRFFWVLILKVNKQIKICYSSLILEKYWVGVQHGHSYLMGDCALLVMVGHFSSNFVTIKIIHGVNALLHWPALHPIFSC